MEAHRVNAKANLVTTGESTHVHRHGKVMYVYERALSRRQAVVGRRKGQGEEIDESAAIFLVDETEPQAILSKELVGDKLRRRGREAEA